MVLNVKLKKKASLQNSVHGQKEAEHSIISELYNVGGQEIESSS